MTRVVVVDDDDMVARVHSAFVERVPGCTVVGSASDGAGALRVGTAQAQVDRLASPGLSQDAGGQLPKGLSPETTGLVQRVLHDAGPDGVSATECAERTGLSRVSARRYLEHFSRTGAAVVSARDGGTGRPERRFRAP